MNDTGLRKVVFSGTCMCGHHTNAHHGHYTTNKEVAKVWQTSRHPGPCLAYDCFEKAGLDTAGSLHCQQYVDAANPDPSERAKWIGTTADSLKKNKK